MKLQYRVKVATETYDVNYVEKVEINKTFKNICGDLKSRDFENVKEYLRLRKIQYRSHIEKILLGNIQLYFPEILENDITDEQFEEIEGIHQNGFKYVKKRTEAPVLFYEFANVQIIEWNEIKYYVENLDDIKEVISKTVELRDIEKTTTNEEERDVTIEMDLANKSGKFENVTLDKETFEEIMEQNEPDFEIENSKEIIDFKKSDHLEFIRLNNAPALKWNKTWPTLQENELGITNIRTFDRSFECLEIFKYYNLYFFKVERSNYDKLENHRALSLLVSDIESSASTELKHNVELYKFLIRKNHLDVQTVKKLINNSSKLQDDYHLIRDVVVYEIVSDGALKLSEKTLTLLSTKLGDEEFKRVIKSTDKNSHKEIESKGLLLKIYDIGFESFLSVSQRKVVKNIKEKEQLRLEEYHKVMGEIVSSGVRENIKSMSGAVRSKFGFGQNFINWLNEYQGHNKGNPINAEALSKAKKILGQIHSWQEAKKNGTLKDLDKSSPKTKKNTKNSNRPKKNKQKAKK